MDVAGAEALAARIAQQKQWREAVAVRNGTQPAVDPDGHALESIRPGVRIYRAERRLEAYEGRTSTVTRRLRKFLVDGSWDAEWAVENVESVAQEPTKPGLAPRRRIVGQALALAEVAPPVPAAFEGTAVLPPVTDRISAYTRP